jgi:hypothetical protein
VPGAGHGAGAIIAAMLLLGVLAGVVNGLLNRAGRPRPVPSENAKDHRR